MAAAQQKVETLGYLDSGEEPTDPDQAGFEEAMDLLGTEFKKLHYLSALTTAWVGIRDGWREGWIS